jgi:uncharacterized protein YaeQ
MALTSTVFTFELSVGDVDRSVYDTLSLRVARHPSETDEYLVARVLAYALEACEGIAFTQGLAEASEPAVEVRDLTGARRAWIEVGTPDADRLHRASKATDRVAVYCHKDPAPWLRLLSGARLHAPEKIHLFALDRQLVARLAGTLDRRNAWSLSRNEGELYVDAGGQSMASVLQALSIPTE